MHPKYQGIDFDNLTYTKSSRSNPSGNCVELAKTPDGRTVIRDTKDTSKLCVFTAEEMSAFKEGYEAGEFDHLI